MLNMSNSVALCEQTLESDSWTYRKPGKVNNWSIPHCKPEGPNTTKEGCIKVKNEGMGYTVSSSVPNVSIGKKLNHLKKTTETKPVLADIGRERTGDKKFIIPDWPLDQQHHSHHSHDWEPVHQSEPRKEPFLRNHMPLQVLFRW